MALEKIFHHIDDELGRVEEVIGQVLKKSRYRSILEVNDYLLKSGGKRIRPALVILSARAASGGAAAALDARLVKIASAIELIHIASLVHDDILDQASLRHNRPTINVKYGQDISISLGDYIYALAFGLISEAGNSDILKCISQAAQAMCEGELIQVIERDNLDLLEERYIVIVKKKTAALFAASCQAGAMFLGSQKDSQNALRHYGLNFGIAFQIIDDYLDLIGGQEKLGKAPGQDIAMGEMTLPLLNLLGSVDKEQNRELISLLMSRPKDYLEKIKTRLNDSGVALRTKKTVSSYLNQAREGLRALPVSKYRHSLFDLTDLILKRGFSG